MSTAPVPASAGEDILFTINDGVGLVTFNRPQARNALTFAMYGRLVEIFSSLPTDGSVKVVVITGAGGKAFAAGTDIAQFRSFETRQHGIDYERSAERASATVQGCPVPAIAAITGACTGGGAGIAASCDLRIASRDIKFGFPIARTLGNCLSAATLADLVALVGQSRVVDMLLTARLIEADEALRIGLVNELVDSAAGVLPRALALAKQLTEHAPITMRVTKELLRRLRAAQGKVDDDDLIGLVYTSADFKEGLEAFLAKRPARWQNR